MPFGLPSPTDLLNEVPGVGSLIDTEEEKRRKRRRAAAAARAAKRNKGKKPPKVPESKKKDDGRGFWGDVGHALTPGAMFADVAGPVLRKTHAPTMVRSIPSDIAELGAGLLPAAKTFGKAGYHDIRHLARHHDAPTLHDMAKYYDLLKWTVADEKGDKRKQPATDSEIVGLLAAMTRGWGRGIERAVPDVTDPADMKEARKAWTEDPVFSALDVLPFGAAITRPLSVAKHARQAALLNDVSRGRALALGLKESYHPGAIRRAGLKGGVEPRVLRGGDVGDAAGRPWSRIPLMREFQRTTDELYSLSPGLSRKRVARARERLANEDKRRIMLQHKELERPIGELLYGRIGRGLGAFGLKEGMNPKERRIATGVAYAFQMPRHMEPGAALEAVQRDLSSVYKDGHMEIPKGRGRTKRVPLTAAEKENLAAQIADLDLVRQELDRGDITHEEWTAAMDAMSTIAGKTHEMGIDIMRRRYNLDDEETAALEAAWKNRAEVLPRRLAARGIIESGDLAANETRTARLAELTDQVGEDQAQFLVALTDARARAARPQNPGGFWDERIGMPTGEGAAEYVARVGDEALFPQMGEHTISDLLFGGTSGRGILDSGEFFSPLQKWIEETMPSKMTAAQLEGTLKNKIPPEEFENAGLDNFFADLDPTEIVTKAEFQAHMASPLNAYNLREILLSNADGVDHDLGTVFDIEHDGNYMARDPRAGEYFELLLQLPGPEIYKGKGVGHWDRPNIAAHVRFHIFHEDGKMKMLVEEIQSDWSNEWRVEREKLKRLGKMSADEQAEVEHIRSTLADAVQQKKGIQRRQIELDHAITQGADDAGDLHMEFLNNADRLDTLNEYIREYERGYAEYGLDGTPVAPLGTGLGARSSYINPTIRWLLRRADEAGVDEIHIVGREVQLGRNAELDPRIFHEHKDAGAEAITARLKDHIHHDRSFLSYDEDIPRAFAREMGVDGTKVDDGVEGTYRFAGVPAEDAWGRIPTTVFKMTDEAKAAAKRPASMYQRQPNWKGLPHGAAELMDGKSIVHMFETGNLSTWIHELGHVGLYDLSPEDLRVIEQHLGGGFKLEDWTKMEHERFARAFEQYVRKGKAPNKDLAAVFGKLSEWMKVIWRQTKGRHSEEIAPEVKDVFDSMFSGPERGEMDVHGYFPHRDIHAQAQADYRGGVRPPAAGQVTGVPRLSGDAIQRKPNELMLYQGGAMNPDPGSLVGVFLNRLRFQETLNARDELWAMGHSMDEPPPKGAWLIRNPDEAPERIRPQAQAAVRGTDLKRPADADLEEMLRLDPEDFRKEVIAKAGENPRWASQMENVRWVEGDYVKTRFGDVFDSKPRGGMSSALGLLTSMQRMTGIYGRPISYIGGNVPFNVLALMSSMPVSTLRNAARVFDIRKNHPALWRAINSESGETRASGGLPEHYVRPQNAIQGAEQRATAVQRGMAASLSGVADDPYRTIAFLNNARKKGYRTNADLQRLIEENGTDLHEVRQLVREQMLDFDALNPSQRRFASQMLYLWPFMYASAKWPAMFAREYPLRAAMAAQAIEDNPERILPQEVTNLWKRYGIDLGTINPIGPLGQMAEDVKTGVEDPTKLDLTALQERLSPTLGVVVEGMGGGRKHALQNFIRQTVPGAAEAFSFDPEYRGAKIYEDRSQESYLAQRHARYWPRGINKQRLQELVDQALKDRVSGTTLEKEKDADWKKIQKYTKAVGGYTDQDVQEISRSYAAWWEYQEAVDQKKDSLGVRKLSPLQQAEVLTPIIEDRFPELAGELWDLTDMDEAYQRKHAKAIDEYATALKTAINEGRTLVFNDYSSYGPQS